MKSETQQRFEEKLKEFSKKLNTSTLLFKDGVDMYDLSENLLLRYEQIRISRDNHKNYRIKLEQEIKRLKNMKK